MTDATYGGDAGSRPGGRTAEDMKSTAMEKADKAKTVVKDQASQLATEAKHKAEGEVERRKDQASETLDDFAEAIRRAAGELNERDHSMGSRFAQQAAEGLAEISRSLNNKSPEDMLRGAREFGRNNPTAFFAASVLAGIALGRVAGSSTPTQEQPDGQGRHGSTPPAVGQSVYGGGAESSLGTGAPAYNTAGVSTIRPGLGAPGAASGSQVGGTSQ